MSTLGKYYHDFPRLAKESGHNFQLFRGKINWIDLDRVNIQEILDNRNFQLLEENLIHVINCNLEEEFDVRGLDSNLVKIFKLAQLGVDYLSYCELYLDRCVILLQEQLSTLQEQVLVLKEENEKKDEELKRNRQKIKWQSQSYKCNKCEKIFLNESYLKSHEERRHRSSGDSNEGKIFKNQAQQTQEEIRTVSEFTQTIDGNTLVTNSVSDDKDVIKISKEELKIDNLMRDLEELKARLSLAEKTMEEKKTEEKNFQNSFPSSIIPVIHSYISPHRNGYFQMTGATAMVQGFPGQYVLQENAEEKSENDRKGDKMNFKEEPQNSSDRRVLKEVVLDHQSPIRVNTAPEITLEEREGNEGVSENAPVNLKNNSLHIPSKPFNESSSKPESDIMAEEIHPKTIPSQANVEVDSTVNNSGRNIWGPSDFISNGDSTLGSEPTNDNIKIKTSTPYKMLGSPKSKTGEKSLRNNWSNAFGPTTGHGMKLKSKSEETLVQDIDLFDVEEKPKFLLRQIVNKKSPKIQGLKTNLKKSFSHLYESVSSVAKKNSDVERGKSKSKIVEGLNSRLKELGIDPEWSGIPRETMKQKLRILEHHRNILTKKECPPNQESFLQNLRLSQFDNFPPRENFLSNQALKTVTCDLLNKVCDWIFLFPPAQVATSPNKYTKRKLEKHVLKKIQRSSLLSSKPTAEMDDESITQTNKNGGTVKTSPSEITVYESDGDSDSDVLESIKDKCPNSPGTSETGYLNTAAGPSKVSHERKDEEREITDLSIFQAGKFKEVKPKVIELEVPDEILHRQKYPGAQDEPPTDSDIDDELFKNFEEQSIQNIAKHLSVKAETPKKDIIGSFPKKVEGHGEFLTPRNFRSENQSIMKSHAEPNRLTAKKKVLFAEVPEVFEVGAKPVAKTPVDKQKITSSVLDDDDDDWSIESEWMINDEL